MSNYYSDNTETGQSIVKSSLLDVYLALKMLVNILVRPLWVNPATGNLKTEVLSGVIAVTNLSQIGGQDVYNQVIVDQMKIAWALCVRRNIT